MSEIPMHSQWEVRIIFIKRDTLNPLYNDIRYNSKIRYNVNLVRTKISRCVFFFIVIPMLFFRKTYLLYIC